MTTAQAEELLERVRKRGHARGMLFLATGVPTRNPHPADSDVGRAWDRGYFEAVHPLISPAGS